MNTMANRTSKKSAKVAKKAAVKRVAAKAAKPRKTAPKSRSRKVAKPALLAGGNPQIAKADGELNALVAQSGALSGTASWPAGITTVRSREGKTLTTDGPFAETREGVGGFFLVDVQELDAAIKVAERAPGARYGAVEIRPVQA